VEQGSIALVRFRAAIIHHLLVQFSSSFGSNPLSSILPVRKYYNGEVQVVSCAYFLHIRKDELYLDLNQYFKNNNNRELGSHHMQS
jgi:hypothetical protein